MKIERLHVADAFWRECGFSHMQRYTFARERVTGRVLDVACGVGYGTFILRGVSESVVGVDVSADAIAEAKQHHQRPGIVFHLGQLATLPGGPAEFDAAVCLETIEHLADPVAFLAELHHRLKPGGRLIVSAPNTLQHKRGVPPQPNEYHLSEPTYAELSEWLAPHFTIEDEWEQTRILAPEGDLVQQMARTGAEFSQLGLMRRFAHFERTLRRWLGKPPSLEYPRAPERNALIADTAMLPLLPARRALAHTFVFVARRK